MAKTLLLLVQSPNIDTYVNVLTHCVQHEQVENIIFVGREGLANESTSDELVRKISVRVRQLAEQYDEYKSASQTLPPDEKLKERIERIDFLRPHLSLAHLKEKFGKSENVIVDITAASTQVSNSLMASFMTDGFEHICYFALHDKVYSSDWGKTKLYHDLVSKGQTNYSYSDFSKSDSIKYSFDKLRSRGKWVRILLLLSSLLVITVIVLIATQQTNTAQIVAITSAITIVAGLLESVANLSKQFTGLFSSKS
ncbi:MAG TPA: hypothetical protein PLX90_12655 [Anaerolineales bacterium]|nr:hypothetical protein [Anaerolineales bacterium]